MSALKSFEVDDFDKAAEGTNLPRCPAILDKHTQISDISSP